MIPDPVPGDLTPGGGDFVDEPLFPVELGAADRPAGVPILTGPPFGCPTSLSGTAFDPSGRLPLYNVVVYVPSETLSPITQGAGCETCDGNFSGRPVAAAVTDAAGNFTLALDEVPATATLPLVIQVGKWRRQIEVPNIAACGSNTVANGAARLPRDRTEGNLPHIAIMRGGSDALECLFRKIGVSDSEFSTDQAGGSFHLYASALGSAEAGTTQFADGTPIAPPAALLDSLDRLMTYDAVFMACEGDGRSPYTNSPASRFSNIQTYADQGGRIFGSHYHNYWVRTDKFAANGVAPYPEVAVFPGEQHGFEVDVTGDVNASFPKGAALRDWLVNVGGSTTPGQLVIHDGEHTVDSVIPGVATAWITTTDNQSHEGVVQYFSFTTPVGQTECGRMVFSDLHVASGTGDSGKLAFPSGCTSTELSPQEKALTYMLFDLSSCVQPDTAPIVPPTIIR